MGLLFICLVVLTINSAFLFVFLHKTTLINLINYLKKNLNLKRSSFTSNFDLKNINYKHFRLEFRFLKGSNKELKILEAKRIQDLALEKEQLSSKLKMLEYLSVFELYLNQNNTKKDRVCQINEFKNLKLSTQRSILESTKKVSYLSVA
ncbi:MAG: hypothetical protein ABJM36_05335 [Algibacter sp.]|uniref:hypothetical protein n=1 Tax=Algibacter sp. TaxID=1872428 RepID=UPI0032993753